MKPARSFARRRIRDDLQLNFGVIANDAMGDSVKVTVIATGLHEAGEETRRESVIEPKPVRRVFHRAHGGTSPLSHDMFRNLLKNRSRGLWPRSFEEELDVPAYLRQGKLLN